MAINLDHVTEQITVTDDATNASLTVQSKGTGAFNVAAGSSGVNISNGGTITALTRTATGSGYTGIPSVAISAPTTAGGVQATASVTMAVQNANVTVNNGGTGYSVNDVLTVVGGTGTAAQIIVNTVSGGVITSAFRSNSVFGIYTALPTNPVSVTGGTGSGATFNLLYEVLPPTITAAGSGYVEQPTVTFSGGGGSGAAAYATVGGTTVLRTIGGNIQFNTPAGTQLQINDASSPTVYPYITGGSGGAGIGTLGATNGSISVSARGTGIVNFFTNNFANEQLRVSHTASAVNYVQVTGSVTGAPASALASITFTGSDASVSGAFVTKGNGLISFSGGGTTNAQAFRVNTSGASSAGNLIIVQGAAAGSAPSLTATSGFSGTDANVDMSLLTKGSGLLRFGTYTAGALSITGYIEIKDAGGTIRRLAVVA